MDLKAFSRSYLVQVQRSWKNILAGTHNGIRGPLDNSNRVADPPFKIDLVSCSWDESTTFKSDNRGVVRRCDLAKESHNFEVWLIR